MNILIASTAVPGHLNPLLTTALVLQKYGHEITVVTAAAMRPLVEAQGLRFIEEQPDKTEFVRHLLEGFPERDAKDPWMERTGFDIEQWFAPHLTNQYRSLQQAIEEFAVDLIIVDSLYWGTIPLLLGPRSKRPYIVHLGITVVNFGSGNDPLLDLSDAERVAHRDRKKRLLQEPAQRAINKELANLGLEPLPCPALESMSLLPDLYLHPGIKSFEYPLSPSSRVQFIGSLPLPPTNQPLPAWWESLDTTKHLVLVTQGTIDNRDLNTIIGPTITALADQDDVILLVTTGGAPVDAIPVEIPSNARVETFLPFAKMMDRIDLLITNGGYGTINMALAHGVPLLACGLTEDKEETTAHVQWSGAGIGLRVQRVTAAQVKSAAREILDHPQYRTRAKAMAAEFATHNAEQEILELLQTVAKEEVEAAL